MAKDAIHDAVHNALSKDGWTITAEFLQIEYEELEIYADLVAEQDPIVAEKAGAKIIKTVLHVALQNGKIWIEEDLIEEVIATCFLTHGVPNTAIVLGF